jgi:hypothetical protein
MKATAPRPSARPGLLGLVFAALVTGATPVVAQPKQPPARPGMEDRNNLCGLIFTKHYGPYDYRTRKGNLQVVEEYHFTPNVEFLLRGESSYLGGDIDYTLLASPNHHRALVSIVRLTEKLKSDRPLGTTYPVECYFERAVRFQPDDTVVRVLYAQFLQKRKRQAEAVEQIDIAVGYAEDNPISHNSLGLMYFNLGEYDKALAQAHAALALGWPRTELKDMLDKLGKWREPAPQAAAAGASQASAASAASTPTGDRTAPGFAPLAAGPAASSP